MLGDSLLCCGYYSIVHRHLVLVVLGELGVVGCGRICPGLMEHQLHILFGAGQHILFQLSKIGFVGVIDSGTSTCLLEADIVPFFVCKPLCESFTRLFGFLAVHHLPVGIVSQVTFGFGHVRGKGTSTDIHIADYYFLSGSIEQVPEILLHGILREAVAYREDTDDAIGRLYRGFLLNGDAGIAGRGSECHVAFTPFICIIGGHSNGENMILDRLGLGDGDPCDIG